VVVSLAVLLCAGLILTGKRSQPALINQEAGAIRIRAGASERYVDRFGRVWDSDKYFKGGAARTTRNLITGGRDSKIYESRRDGAFNYDIPLVTGAYELLLHFAEVEYGESNPKAGGETSRLFDILANGTRILQRFDVLGEVGPNTADVKLFNNISPGSDGYLHLQFVALNGNAFVSAIEITAGTPGGLRPMRFVAADQTYTDAQGRIWAPDRYVSGGRIGAQTQPVSGTLDPGLFRSERYGAFTYSFPVTPGEYRVTFYFSEAWFGPDPAQSGGGGGIGSRMFDIFSNGTALVRNLDIYQEAGGSHRALIKSFRGMKPNAQSKIIMSFVPVRNYGSLNAIEVVQDK
jgi:hypothetical protein